jgi:hypothetical protein
VCDQQGLYNHLFLCILARWTLAPAYALRRCPRSSCFISRISLSLVLFLCFSTCSSPTLSSISFSLSISLQFLALCPKCPVHHHHLLSPAREPKPQHSEHPSPRALCAPNLVAIPAEFAVRSVVPFFPRLMGDREISAWLTSPLLFRLIFHSNSSCYMLFLALGPNRNATRVKSLRRAPASTSLARHARD